MPKRLIPLCAALCFSNFLFSIPNQIAPSSAGAGIIERELEKEYGGRPFEEKQEAPAIQIDIPTERINIPPGLKICIKSIAVCGNQAVSEKEILSWIKAWRNRCDNTELSLYEIYQLCSFLEDHYVKKGYFLTRVYPPAQEVADCDLRLEVIEGSLGSIEIVGNKFYSTSFIKSYLSSLQGKPLNYGDFLHALMLLNDNKDLSAGALFQKGKKFGTADVLVQIKDSAPTHLYLNGNNYGRFLTTNARMGGRFDYGSFATYGDQLSVAGVMGFPIKALYFYDAKYTVPLNRKGAFLQFAYLYSKFHIEELQKFRLRGAAQIATVRYNQALIRRPTLSCDLFTYFDYKQIQDFVLGTLAAYDKLRILTFGSVIDSFSASTRDYLTLRLSGGIPDFLGGLKAVDPTCSRPGGGGRFYMFNADYDHIHQLPADLLFTFHGSIQLSPSKLTLPELFYIGGESSVRGFPLAVALGDNGYYMNCELRFPPPFLANKSCFGLKKKWKDVLQFDLFLDQGGTILQSESNTFLWGTGAGVRLSGPWNMTTSLDVGFPLNHKDLTRGVFLYLKVTGQPF